MSNPIARYRLHLDELEHVLAMAAAALHHGMADPTFHGTDTIDYERMAAASGGMDKVQGWSRFYAVPGMLHCRGSGPSPTVRSARPSGLLEKDVAPDSVIATGKTFRAAPAVVRIRSTPATGNGRSEDTRTVCRE
jgi:hypothetical protein